MEKYHSYHLYTELMQHSSLEVNFRCIQKLLGIMSFDFIFWYYTFVRYWEKMGVQWTSTSTM